MIAVGYIPTVSGEAALDEAMMRAERDGCAVHVINVVRDDRPHDVRHASAQQVRELHERARERALEFTFSQVRTHDGASFPSTFLNAVRASGANLLIVGSRRDTSHVPAHLRGLTLQHIIADAPCSVLVMPTTQGLSPA